MKGRHLAFVEALRMFGNAPIWTYAQRLKCSSLSGDYWSRRSEDKPAGANLRKPQFDDDMGVVPRDGVEPPTLRFSVDRPGCSVEPFPRE